MKTTGKYSKKPYQCTSCGKVSEIGTNHWGEIYPICRGCGFMHPHCCLEAPPEGISLPEPWKIVRLGDVAEIVQGERLPR